MLTIQSKDGTTIAYDKVGEGPALVFIMGAICHRRFAPVVKDVNVIAQRFTVYPYDRRGRGDSTDTQPFAVDRELDDLEALIDQIGAPVAIYGHSSGAVLALEAAARFPEKIKKVAIYDPPYAHSETEISKNEVELRKIEGLLARRKFGAAIRVFLSNIGMPKPFIYLMPLFPGWAGMKALAPTLKYDLLITNRLPPLEKMAKIDRPVLLMYGAKNDYDFGSVVETLGSVIRDSKIVKVLGQDHMVKPEIVLKNLVEFLSR